MNEPREPAAPRVLPPHDVGRSGHAAPRPADSRRFLARVLAVAALIAALALAVSARACAQADRCAQAGGHWDEEWKVCRQ